LALDRGGEERFSAPTEGIIAFTKDH
jgi:hypothetical protein